MKYTHLTQDERYQIAILAKAGHDKSEIARLMERHKSTISREMTRNRGARGYRPKQAHARSQSRIDPQEPPSLQRHGSRLSGVNPPFANFPRTSARRPYAKLYIRPMTRHPPRIFEWRLNTR
ncbi:helix-turn-helix domain-containing protein [Thiobacillus denitrificans]|uniref:helix-turn-helix domain-containing protein n=1 Tax=Thiobacillus denitrificans TaxID=36861 RepID=UPI0009EA3AD0